MEWSLNDDGIEFAGWDLGDVADFRLPDVTSLHEREAEERRSFREAGYANRYILHMEKHQECGFNVECRLAKSSPMRM
jgi:hypothetical protein